MGFLKIDNKVIEGITIDFWNSIAEDPEYVSRLEERAKAAHEYLTGLGFDFSLTELNGLFNEFSAEWGYKWSVTQYTPGPLECAAHIINGLRVKLKPAQVEELAKTIEVVILEMPPEQVEGSVEAIKKLHTHLPLAVVCDTGVSGPKMIDELLSRWGILNLLDARIYSLEVGVSKPSAVMFRSALDKMGVPVNRSLHIGDLEHTDIKGSKELGMMAIRFDGVSSTIEQTKNSRADYVVNSWAEILELFNL
jgi:putative hydrolase of the HAD superfamily